MNSNNISSNNIGNNIGSNNTLIYIIIILVVVVIAVISFNKYNEYGSIYKNISEYQFKTGDIILISENGLFGYSISLLAGSKYSHCGIVIDGEKRLIAHSHLLNNSKNDIMPILLIKSEINKSYDIKDSGVIIEHIDTFINNGSIKKLIILPIKNEIDNDKMLNAYTYYMNKPYKQSIVELININNNLFKNRRNDSSLFCSEFIIELLQYMNIIDKNIISNTITPDKLLELSSHDKKKLVIINFNIDKNMLINSFLYKLLSFIRLPIILINNFISSV
jgi:hypothetical protein